MQTTITPTKHYTCYEIVKQGLIPGIRTIQQMTALARTDKLTNQYLDATITKRGDKGTQYQILGANIIKYLVNHE